jgi:spermidine/putrescine-binding protein
MRKEILQRTALSRRELARSAAAAGLAMVTLPAIMKPKANAAGELVYLTWSGYDLPEFNPSYSAKYGGEPEYSIFANQEEAVQKVNGGFVADVVHPCSETVIRWSQAGLIKPIDTSRIESWDKIWPDLKGLQNANDEQGNVLFCPWEWGNSSIIYRTDLVDAEESWMMMFDEKYAGKISMYNEAAAAVEIAGMALGYENIFSLDDAQLAEVKKLLQKQRELCRFYWNSQSEIEQGLASGEIVMAYGWNDGLLHLKQQGVPVAYAVPKEGIRTWVCGFILTNVGEGDEQAVYDFMNSRLEVAAGKYLIENYGYGHANSDSFAAVPKSTLDELGIGEPEKVMSESVFLQGELPPYDEIYIKLYEEVQAGL